MILFCQYCYCCPPITSTINTDSISNTATNCFVFIRTQILSSCATANTHTTAFTKSAPSCTQISNPPRPPISHPLHFTTYATVTLCFHIWLTNYPISKLKLYKEEMRHCTCTLNEQCALFDVYTIWGANPPFLHCWLNLLLSHTKAAIRNALYVVTKLFRPNLNWVRGYLNTAKRGSYYVRLLRGTVYSYGWISTSQTNTQAAR
jgi:hypothetical protein